jgi:serine/threonine-protein kinase RsbT
MNGSVLAEYTFGIMPGDINKAGKACSAIKKSLKSMGLAETLIRRVCISCYEVEMNMVIHSYGGSMSMQVYPNEIVVIAQDTGPGIPDIELAMQDGYSTAPLDILRQGFGAGRGLSNIKNYSDRFYIDSAAGKGTRIEMHFILSESINSHISNTDHIGKNPNHREDTNL